MAGALAIRGVWVGEREVAGEMGRRGLEGRGVWGGWKKRREVAELYVPQCCSSGEGYSYHHGVLL